MSLPMALVWLFSIACIGVGVGFALGLFEGEEASPPSDAAAGEEPAPKVKMDDEPIITPPPKKAPKPKPWEAPELQDIPFDPKPYRDAEIAKQVAKLRPYAPETPCLKCGASGNPDPHNATLKCYYYVPSHETEKENERRQSERKYLKAIAEPFGYMPYFSHYLTMHDKEHVGPSFIRRSCFKCGFTWDELALDEVAKQAAV